MNLLGVVEGEGGSGANNGGRCNQYSEGLSPVVLVVGVVQIECSFEFRVIGY